MLLTENPLESIHTTMTTLCKDMSLTNKDAWMYGVIVGWNNEVYEDFKKG